jgi:hypothetical protein
MEVQGAKPSKIIQTANIAKVWNDIANQSTFMNADEKRQLVANQVGLCRCAADERTGARV